MGSAYGRGLRNPASIKGILEPTIGLEPMTCALRVQDFPVP